jgi:hypothetical protein
MRAVGTYGVGVEGPGGNGHNCTDSGGKDECIGSSWAEEDTHNRALNFYPIFIPLLEGKVSGVSVQDMLLRLPSLTPETKFAEQKRV